MAAKHQDATGAKTAFRNSLNLLKADFIYVRAAEKNNIKMVHYLHKAIDLGNFPEARIILGKCYAYGMREFESSESKAAKVLAPLFESLDLPSQQVSFWVLRTISLFKTDCEIDNMFESVGKPQWSLFAEHVQRRFQASRFQHRERAPAALGLMHNTQVDCPLSKIKPSEEYEEKTKTILF